MGQRQETQTYKIVCLEHQGRCLYAEIIQTIQKNQRYWLRPLALSLVTGQNDTWAQDDSEVQQIYDLRDCSDLLWPQTQLRAALDIELLPMLTMLQTEKRSTEVKVQKEAHQQLQAFLHSVCSDPPIMEQSQE